MDEQAEAPQRAPFSNLIQHPEVPHFLKIKPKTLFVGSRSLFDFIQTNPLARRHGLEACNLDLALQV